MLQGMKYRRTFVFLFALFLSITIHAQSNALISREALLQASKTEVAKLIYTEENQSNLGEWKTTIDNVLFLLLRKTELYRGSVRLLVSNAVEYPVRWYPSGVLVISTSLLDFIDTSIYDSASASGKRIRDIEKERETLLAPYCAWELARLALDMPYSSWTKKNEEINQNFMESQDSLDETLTCDNYAAVLLYLAGYKPEIFGNYLNDLLNQNLFEPFSDLALWQKSLTSISVRKNNFVSTSYSPLAEELESILLTLKFNTGLKEASDRLQELNILYPDNIHLTRLIALCAHQRWIDSGKAQDLLFLPFLPLSQANSLGSNFNSMLTSLNAFTFKPINMQSPYTTPGNQSLYAFAKKSYENILAQSQDETLRSSYASLLIYAPDPQTRKQALEIAKNASIQEKNEGAKDFTARANYAQLLFISATDYALSLDTITKLWLDTQVTTTRNLNNYVTRSISGNSQQLLVTQIVMYQALQNQNNAKKLLDDFQKPRANNTFTKIILRNISIGDSIDLLIEKWGKPNTIRYSLNLEQWIYNNLEVSVLINTESKQNQTISAILLNQNSTISPNFIRSDNSQITSDLRLGDSRTNFESILGKSIALNGDSDIYLCGNIIISILYTGDRARSLSVYEKNR